MKGPLLGILICWCLAIAPLITGHHGAVSATQPQQSATAAPADIDRIVAALTAKETQFRNALAQYSFKREAMIQSLAAGGQISGEYRRTSQLAFDSNGKRIEKILHFPAPTLSAIRIATEDLDDPGGVNFFALEAAKASLYNFKYVGKERIDELDLHVFEVAPKAVPDPKKIKERLFQGRIWVDTQGYQIVKTRGKGMPEPKLAPLPTFEIYREEIDGFWFPTYAYADEELDIPGGQVSRIRMRLTFSDFKK